ncbi:MAG: adenylate/guanylate cyclase domain-containing protein [Verrucomicrobia bacterium]|nr:adenylate/guanylate cyclase domain-containing protein [Verrucomicrobiota bacterium]
MRNTLKQLWRDRQHRDRLVVSAFGLFWVVVLIGMQTFRPQSFVARMELASVDQRFRWRAPQPAAPDVMIIGIDEESFAADTFNEKELAAHPELKLLTTWPWPRRAHALALEKLLGAGAKSVGFDLLFSTPSKYGPGDDAALRTALERAKGRVVVGANLTEEVIQGARREKWMMPTSGVVPESVSLLDLCGAVNYKADFDLVARRLRPLWPYAEEGKHLTALSVHTATHAETSAQWATNQHEVLINFPYLPLPQSTFPTVKFYKLFYGKSWQGELRNGAVFKDKIVLIGPTQNFLHDVVATPFGDAVPGVELHAAAISTLLQHNELHPAPTGTESLLILGFAALAVVSLLWIRHPLGKLLPPAAIAVGYGFVGQLAFVHTLTVLPLAAPVLVLLPVTLTGIAWQLLTEQFERRRARQALERQVSKEVADELMKDFGSLQQMLAPQERPIVVFYADIRNFTTIFERGDPQKLIGLLNEYFTEMTAIIARHGGTIDKYIGDAIMAVWGAPTSRGADEDAWHAVAAAVEMRQRLAELRPLWTARGHPEIFNGVGIHYGPALVGEVGSQQRSEYTAIGDTVNTASRIEGINKELGTDLLISEAVYKLVKDRVEARPLGAHALKGRTGQVELYHVQKSL